MYCLALVDFLASFSRTVCFRVLSHVLFGFSALSCILFGLKTRSHVLFGFRRLSRMLFALKYFLTCGLAFVHFHMYSKNAFSVTVCFRVLSNVPFSFNTLSRVLRRFEHFLTLAGDSKRGWAGYWLVD